MSRYNLHFSPSSSHSPQMRTASEPDAWNGHTSFLERYLSELHAERQKLGPFMQVLPNCSRLLNQEITRITSLLGSSSFFDHDPMEHGSPLTSRGLLSNGGGGLDSSTWSSFPLERVANQTSGLGWRVSPTTSMSKKVIRIEVPVDRYPNYNFVGRLLGPRGNSLKRVETTTGCRVYIRGRGSVKDTAQEEQLRGKSGYEHLNEPLHVLVEAEQPSSIIDFQLKRAKDIIEELLKPVDESHDIFKKQQLRELAILNGTLREESPFSSGNVSPFNNNSGMKRAKTGQ